MIWWEWEDILLLFEWEGGGRKRLIGNQGGTGKWWGVRGKGDDTKARQRWGPVRWTEKWIRFT